MRRIAVATFSRSEYSNCLPVLRCIKEDRELKLALVVSGTHLSHEYGYSVSEIKRDGFHIDECIDVLDTSDTPEAITRSVARCLVGFGKYFARARPDILLLMGDRLELLGPATAATAFGIPLAHAFGGDVTAGAIDDQVRNAVSQMSHLHFVAMRAHADRLVAMGEEPWRITVTGDPALGLIPTMSLLDRGSLEETLGVRLVPPVLVVTYHPTTLGSVDSTAEVTAVLAALEGVKGTLIFTLPNADVGNRAVADRIRAFCEGRDAARVFANLGQLKYYSLLRHADLMVGNSSSGLWEAPSFKLPAVNIGERQRGRVRAGNVLDVPADAVAISAAIARGLARSFRETLADLKNPYHGDRAAEEIVRVLKDTTLGPELLSKVR